MVGKRTTAKEESGDGENEFKEKQNAAAEEVANCRKEGKQRGKGKPNVSDQVAGSVIGRTRARDLDIGGERRQRRARCDAQR